MFVEVVEEGRDSESVEGRVGCAEEEEEEEEPERIHEERKKREKERRRRERKRAPSRLCVLIPFFSFFLSPFFVSSNILSILRKFL